MAHVTPKLRESLAGHIENTALALEHFANNVRNEERHLTPTEVRKTKKHLDQIYKWLEHHPLLERDA